MSLAEQIVLDVRQGLRALVMRRGATALTIVALALVVGASLGIPEFLEWQEESGVFENLAAFNSFLSPITKRPGQPPADGGQNVILSEKLATSGRRSPPGDS